MPDPTTTIMYVPTLIETVEQAEKLPAGARLMRHAVDESDEGGMGYADGYEAAQRERGPIEAVGKPLPPAVPLHFASEEPQGRPGR